MNDSAAARLADSLRTAMKDQALNGAGLADRIERLTGSRPTPTWISRRLGAPAVTEGSAGSEQAGRSRAHALIRVDESLFVLARALEVDRATLIEMVTAAIFGDAEQETPDTAPYATEADRG